MPGGSRRQRRAPSIFSPRRAHCHYEKQLMHVSKAQHYYYASLSPHDYHFITHHIFFDIGKLNGIYFEAAHIEEVI